MKKSIAIVLVVIITVFCFPATTLAATNYPFAPSNIRIVANQPNAISLIWDKVNNATGYEIYRCSSSSGQKWGSFKLIYRVAHGAQTCFVDTSITFPPSSALRYYKYKIRAIKDSNAGSFSKIVSTSVSYAKPTNLRLKALSSNSIKVTWDKTPGAVGYYVRRTIKQDSGALTFPVNSGNTTTFVDNGLDPNTTYYYFINARFPYGGGSRVGTQSDTYSCKTKPKS